MGYIRITRNIANCFHRFLSRLPTPSEEKHGGRQKRWIMMGEKLRIVDGEVTLAQLAHTNNVKVTELFSIKRQVMGEKPV
jgi:hypothetical protein